MTVSIAKMFINCDQRKFETNEKKNKLKPWKKNRFQLKISL